MGGERRKEDCCAIVVLNVLECFCMKRTVQERESLFFLGELAEVASLDLHGQSVAEALSHLDQFLHQCFVAGDEVVQVIHGRGTGVLREAVHKRLAKMTIVEDFQDSDSPASITGMTLVILHPSK